MRDLLVKILFAVTTCIVIALMYAQLATPKYQVTASAVVQRPRVENPELNSEEIRNRWVWLRDGYGARENILSEPTLAAAIAEYPSAINVQFTGGDVNSFVITVIHKSPEEAVRLANIALTKVKEFYVDKVLAEYEAVLVGLKAKQKTVSDKDEQQILRSSYNKLLVAKTIFQQLSPGLVKTLKSPSLPETPIWPNLKVLCLFALLAGVGIGLVSQYGSLLLNGKKK